MNIPQAYPESELRVAMNSLSDSAQHIANYEPFGRDGGCDSVPAQKAIAAVVALQARLMRIKARAAKSAIGVAREVVRQ